MIERFGLTCLLRGLVFILVVALIGSVIWMVLYAGAGL